MRGPPLYENKGYIGHCAVIDEVLEGVRPEEHADSPQQFEADADGNKDGAGQEVEEKSVPRGQSFVG